MKQYCAALLVVGVSFFLSVDANADGCDPIRAALDRLPAEGGLALIPAGTYECNEPVVLDRNGIGIDGGGRVTLRLADNANAPLLIMGETETPPRAVYDITVKNIRFEGNREHQQFECWGGACDSGGNAFIRNNGITIRGVVRGRVENVVISGARSGGMVTERYCQELVVDGMIAKQNHFDGLAGYQTYNSRFTNLDLSENQAAGISLDLDFSENIVSNAVLSRNGDVGIFMRGSNHNVFSQVKILDSGNHGIFLAEAGRPGTCANFNEFADLVVNRSKGFGFLLNNPCVGNRLSGVAEFSGNTLGCTRAPEGGVLGQPDTLQCSEGESR